LLFYRAYWLQFIVTETLCYELTNAYKHAIKLSNMCNGEHIANKPCEFAAKKNDLELLKTVIAMGADVNETAYYIPLYTAVKNNYFDIVKVR